MADEAQTPSPSIFNPNRPRTHLDHDELGRKGFVRSVWRALRNHDASEAIVVSVQAPWGDGKTTLKEMVVNLEETEGKGEKLLFVHFNPWEWAAQNQVATAFFGELAKQIEECIGKGLGKRFTEALGKTVRSLPHLFGLLESGSKGVALATAPINPPLALGAVATAGIAKEGKDLAEKVAKHHTALSAEDTPSVQSTKTKVRKQFEAFKRKTGRNIVVFIDDIDRLSGDEIRQVLQLVKINADFPGLIFVLLFDKEYVERRLRRHFGSDAARFLEKIVQVELALPKASEDHLYGSFKSAVKDVLKKRPAYLAIFEEERLKQAFDAWFQYHLVNPRKSGRLLSSWTFRVDVFDTGAAEVNPVDLLVMEGLALYEPGVYRELSQAFDDLFPGAYVDFRDFILSRRGKTGEKGTTRIQSLHRVADKVQETTRPVVAAALKLLLGVEGSDFADVDAKESSHRIRFRRFSEGRFFRRYFRLTIDSGDVSKATIQKLVKSIGTPIAFLKQLTILEGRGVLLDALDQLLAEDVPPPPDLPHFLAHLLDWWEERIIRRGSEKEDTGLAHALIRLYEQLMGTRGGKDRSDVLQAMFQQTNAVFAFGNLVFHEQGKRHRWMKAKSPDTTEILEESGEREICDEVAKRLARHFRNHAPAGRPYELEACWWAPLHGGSWRPDIGRELIKTAGGTFSLMRGALRRSEDLPTLDERRVAARLMKPVVSLSKLAEAVREHRDELRKFDATEDWERFVGMIQEGEAENQTSEASGQSTRLES
jgi:predicted KAP-like P-loop ATPase